MKIRAEIIQQIRGGGVAELRQYLQSAIELEHATIPAYQTALFSIKPGRNAEAAEIIRSVTNQEMLHMAIAANVLNAIGGAPVIDKPGFIPVFPGPLPMGIGDVTVTLEKLSRGHVYRTFMAIEQPEERLEFPVKEPRLALLDALPAAPVPQEFATIGEFYDAITTKICDLGQAIFTGDPERQVVDETWFPPDQLFPILTAPDAVRALTLIVRQGEGTRHRPTEPDGTIAHYYRFAEIVYARRLVRDPREPGGFSYSGAPVPLDPSGVWNILANAKTVDYPVGSRVRHLAEQFNYSYTSLLKGLDETFNGHPGHLKACIGIMFEMKLLAGALTATPIEGTDLQGAPTFEYTPLPL